MKLSTFYNIFYNHRVKKAKLILKIYILLTFPIAYIKDNEKNYFLENFYTIEIYIGGRGNEIAFIKKK